MKTTHSLTAAAAVAGLFVALGAGAADANQSDANCRMETKRVAVWPRTAPRAPQMARFEERQVKVCDATFAAADEQRRAKDDDK